MAAFIHLYTVPGNTAAFPIITERLPFGTITTAFKAVGAPDPPLNTILHSWQTNTQWIELEDIGTTAHWICRENGQSAVILAPPLETPLPDTEIRIRGKIVMFPFLGIVTLALDRRCSSASINRPGATGTQIKFLFTVFDNWELEPFGQAPIASSKIPGNRSPIPSLIITLEQFTTTALLIDPQTIPRDQLFDRIPRRRPIERAAPKECFDPTTLKRVDCETGLADGEDPCAEPFIKLPSFDDLVHFKPRPALPWVCVAGTPDNCKRWGFDRELNQEEAEEFIRRREIRTAIENSTVPELVQNIGSVMTWIDNIQDALLTTLVVARLAIPVLPPIYKTIMLGALGVSDAMQLLATGGVGLIGLRSYKGQVIKHAALTPGSVAWNTDALRRLERITPTLGEVLQILQTTDWLLGVGISLGPIVGLILDLIFGIPQGASIGWRSECMNQNRAKSIKQLEKLGLIPLGSIEPQPRDPIGLQNFLKLIEVGLRGLSFPGLLNSRLVSGSPQLPGAPFTQAEYLQQLLAYSTFLDMAESTMKDHKIEDLLARVIDTEVKAPENLSRTEGVLEDIGEIMSPAPARLPLPGSPISARPIDHLVDMARSHQRAFKNHLNLDPTSTPSIYLRFVADDIARKTIRLLDPDHQEPSWTPTAELRAAHNALDKGFHPPPGKTAAEIQADLTALIAATPDIDQAPPDFDTLRRVLAPRGWRGP